jgi:hypothetical protein
LPIVPTARARLSAVPAAVLAAAGMVAGSAWAGDPKPLGTFQDWTAFRLEETGGPACYMIARPRKSAGDAGRRGDVYVLVTHRPAENSLDVVSISAGYSFAPRAEATVQIGKQSFRLFTDGDSAWAREPSVDHAIVQAIRQNASMVVRGTSARGAKTVDTYSLAGSSAAYQAISQACNVTGR